ncbi:MAG TPA: methylmalonyl-CoA mutase family protein [Edaphocola sp.]|nr:methylmalonyl-CoA mutase family protein [Edaphocola sp.]
MENLFAEFKGASLQDWKEKVVKDLKGQPFEVLLSEDDNHLSLEPFYNRENTATETATNRQNPGWHMMQNISVTDFVQANKEALKALNNGADALCFDLRTLETVDFSQLLRDIELSYIKVSFEIGHSYKTIIDSFEAFLKSKNLDSSQQNIAFHFDPTGNYMAAPGGHPLPDGKNYPNFYEQSGRWFGLSVNAALYQNAGANSVSQLAYATAHVHEYIHWLQDVLPQGSEISLNIQLATSTLFFEEIAKLRALPGLIQRLLQTYGFRPRLNFSVQTSDIYRSPVDVYTNLLRDSIAGMAAVIGGCHDLSIHAFNATQQNPKKSLENGQRLALNQQLIFKEESYLDKVADMAAGSFYIEKRTEELAQEAWRVFQAIEKEGGLLAYFALGNLKKDIQQQAADLLAQYRNGTRVLIGVNKFPNPMEEESAFLPKIQNADDNGLRPVNLAEELLKSGV